MSSAGIKYDTRLSIGIGSVDFVAENRISDFRGLAFTLSGRGLDGMKHAHPAFDGSFGESDDWRVRKRRLPDHCIPATRKPDGLQTEKESLQACFYGLILMDEQGRAYLKKE